MRPNLYNGLEYAYVPVLSALSVSSHGILSVFNQDETFRLLESTVFEWESEESEVCSRLSSLVGQPVRLPISAMMMYWSHPESKSDDYPPRRARASSIISRHSHLLLTGWRKASCAAVQNLSSRSDGPPRVAQKSEEQRQCWPSAWRNTKIGSFFYML